MARKTTTTTTLNIRGIDAKAVALLKPAAAARGLTLGQYVYRLALLHAAVRARAAGGDADAVKDLVTLGLQTVTA